MNVIGIDVGGSKTVIGLVDTVGGRVERTVRLETPAHERAGGDFLGRVAEEARALAADEALPVGVGICEAVDRAGEIVSAHRVPWTSAEVRAAFSFAPALVLDSDVRAAAVAEACFGVGRGLGDWLYANAGTGIASVVMRAAVPYLGCRGRAMGLGMSHLVEEDPRREPVSIEDIAGGAGMLMRARAAGLAVPSVAVLIARAEAGDASTRVIVAGAGALLGRALGFLANVLDPEAVVLGGGMPSASPTYLTACRRALEESLWRPAPLCPELRVAGLGPESGLVGAALLAAPQEATAFRSG
ncbi:MAG: ROK family protein [Nitratireductor sp.]